MFRRIEIPNRLISFLLLAIVAATGLACAPESATADESPEPAFDPSTRVHVSDASDPKAIEIAQATIEKMGGWQAWDRTRFLSWKFFGGRQHYWDRWTGDVRIEGQGRDGNEFLFLVNIQEQEGRAWQGGEEVTDPETLKAAVDGARQMWVNDSYWLIMPFKLLDPGVTLKYAGEQEMEDGRASDVLELTFDSVGYTPQNRYHVFVAKDTGLVEQWSFFANAADEEPGYTLPWTGWQTFGEVQIATVHGQDRDWQIAVHDSLPASVFESADPVAGL
ncbi:hypothetical protein [Moorena bouillonii]|uniref:hypothetical protein n=1 Tax=Moorena bouillonii TaxID=207920 RepID=UPI0007F0A1DB|nr:hypothetical protein [Moorena bouillonii]ANM28705.1 hypothetical protein ABI59_02405 [Acidobacteria bacterium Mor1]